MLIKLNSIKANIINFVPRHSDPKWTFLNKNKPSKAFIQDYREQSDDSKS